MFFQNYISMKCPEKVNYYISGTISIIIYGKIEKIPQDHRIFCLKALRYFKIYEDCKEFLKFFLKKPYNIKYITRFDTVLI